MKAAEARILQEMVLYGITNVYFPAALMKSSQ